MFVCILQSVLEDSMQLLHAFNTSESETLPVSENRGLCNQIHINALNWYMYSHSDT